MSDFILGFTAVTRVISVVCGGAAAIALALITALIAYGILSAIFDVVTTLIAMLWQRRGYEPKSRLGKIIRASADRRDGKV